MDDCLKATEPLRVDSLFFNSKFPEIPGIHEVLIPIRVPLKV